MEDSVPGPHLGYRYTAQVVGTTGINIAPKSIKMPST